MFFFFFLLLFLINMEINFSLCLMKNLIFIDFNLNLTNTIFMIIMILISMKVSFYSIYYFNFKMKFKYKINLMIFIVSMVLLISSNNLISMMIGWDGLGISSFFLISYYSNNESCISSMITFFFNRMGDSLIMIFSSILLNMNTNMNNFNINMLLIIILFTSLITKSAQIPFGLWLPEAMAAPTPISSLVHSSTLVTAGIFILMKINYLLFLFEFQVMILMFGLLTFLLGGLFSFSINDIKKAVAFSTLSQLGIIMISLSLGNFKISFYHMIIHALFKSSLFMSLGMYMNYNFMNQNINNMKKTNSNMMSNMFFLYSNLNLMGMVSMVGFFSKDQILFFFNNNFMMLYINIMIYMGCIFTGMYSMKFMFMLMNEKFIYSSFFFQLKMNFMMFLMFFSLLLMFFTMIIFQDLYISDLEILMKMNNKTYFYMINILSLLFFKMFKLNYFNKNFSSMLMMLDLMFQMMKKMKFMNKFYLFMMLEEFSQLNLINAINLSLINIFNINIIIITFLWI